MKIIETTFERLPRERLVIGFEGENLRATVRIDCSSVFAEYPNATPTLIVKPLFADAYPVVVDRNGTDVDWLITSEILSFSGYGEIQLVFYKDQVICKSAVSKIRVSRSLTVTGDMPDPVVQWIENANRKLAEVDAQIVELEGMVDTATDAATRAEQSETNATDKAAEAATSASTASTKAAEAQASANTATAKASEAALSATQARNSAMSAANSESGATAKAAEAAQSAQTAAQKAEQITEAAQIATGKAGEASASATAAQASATNAASSATAASASETAAKASETAASTSATQAGTSAQNAGTAAQTATQKAAEATQSATNAATFAGTATSKAEEAAESAQAASDAKTAVEQTAEQLAESLEQIEQNTQDIAELDERKANIDGYYPDMTVGNAEQLNSSKYVENSEPYTLRTSGGSSDIGNREYLDAVVGGTVAWNQMVRDEASENSTDFAPIVTVTDAVEDAAGVKVKIEPVQDLHGYDYPWPAGGGKNKFNTDFSDTTINGTAITKLSDGKVSTSGVPTSAFDLVIGTATLPAGDYILNGCPAGGGATKYRLQVTDFPVHSNLGQDSGSGVSFTLSEEMTIAVRIQVYTGASASLTYAPMIRLASETDGTFAPYSNICPITGWDGVQIVVSPTTDAADGQTYSITLPTEAGTVYGGELNVATGELVVTHISIPVDGTPNQWISGYIEGTDGNADWLNARLTTFSGDNLTSGARIPPSDYYRCSFLPYKYSNADGTAHFYKSSNFNLFLAKTVFPDIATVVSWLNANPQSLWIKLKTPTTYQLTPTEIRTLLGENNLWADTGDLALTYTGTDEHLTLESGKKYLSHISGTDSMLLGSGQEITAAKGTDNVFDLTQMFSTAVADYVYGQGASFFRRWFGKQRYPYNAGELRHVEGLQSHDMVGFNQWDEEWELGAISESTGENVADSTRMRSKNLIPVLPGTRYYISGVRAKIYYYDASGAFLSATSSFYGPDFQFTPDSNVRFIRWQSNNQYGTTYKHDICISLANNNSRNGEYEPYEKHSYPLDSSVVLRGIPKVGANGVYWDGDRYLPDGTVERRYGVVGLSTIPAWNSDAVSSSGYVRFITPNAYLTNKKEGYNLISDKLIASDAVVPSSPNAEMISGFSGSKGVYVSILASKLSGDLSTANGRSTAFVNYLANNEITIVYELAAPTTETAQPYHSTQWVSDWGTEEFVSTGFVPVGHETRYPANLRDKLQHLPDAASGNGSYLITQTDGQMVLTPFPAPPSTAGNYVLKATVTGGVATYTWEVAT